MDPGRRRRVEALCDAALDRDLWERAAFVAAACEDDEALRGEVEALLSHAQAAEGFLVTPLVLLCHFALNPMEWASDLI